MEHHLKEFVPPGHFYSPIPAIESIVGKDFSSLVSKELENIPGINFNIEGQLKLLRSFAEDYKVPEWLDDENDQYNFHFNNPFFSYGDASALGLVLQHYKPSKIIEVGSGYSTALFLDMLAMKYITSKVTCIEPYPNVLYSLISETQKSHLEIIENKLETIPISKFSDLIEGDLLFIDSTHVSKFDSDVNYLFSEILPVLKSGVLVHIHDIFYPFEYPKEWLLEGRAWNEAYILKAFLQYNDSFEILFWPSMLHVKFPNAVKAALPKLNRNPGASIYLRRM
jgi:predicted O-methyltransferase YrrM